eukprot:860800-Pleurochrysis_carterae.AAC.2
MTLEMAGVASGVSAGVTDAGDLDSGEAATEDQVSVSIACGMFVRTLKAPKLYMGSALSCMIYRCRLVSPAQSPIHATVGSHHEVQKRVLTFTLNFPSLDLFALGWTTEHAATKFRQNMEGFNLNSYEYCAFTER